MSILTTLGGGLTGASPTKSIKLVILGVLLGVTLLACGFLAFKYHSMSASIETLKSEKSVLETNNKIMQANNQVLKENMDALVQANKSTADTTDALIKERSKAQLAINTLASSTVSDKALISNLKQKLADIIKDPANDGTLAPSLRETIRQVQNSRSSK
jgi:cell division protein FtsB